MSDLPRITLDDLDLALDRMHAPPRAAAAPEPPAELDDLALKLERMPAPPLFATAPEPPAASVDLDGITALVRAVAAEILSEQAGPKRPWESRAIWGSAMVVVSQLAQLVGVDIDAGAATEIALAVAGLVGGTLALWGRWKATQPIRWRQPRQPAA